MKRGFMWLASAMLAMLAMSGLAQADDEFKAGTDYTVLEQQIKDPDTKGPYLLEYLWLGCSHCQAMNPLVKAFEESHPKVSIVRRPAVGNDRWVFDAHVFYALFSMGHGDLIYDIMEYYRSLARSERRLPDLADVKGYIASKGIDPQQFEKMMDSDENLARLSVAYRDQQSFGLKGVPVFLVSGKYQIRFEALSKAKDPQTRFTALVEYLLKQS
nr:thioredoxin domain-containing protein [Shewanella avicenniae]